jgi:hypothetical protein
MVETLAQENKNMRRRRRRRRLARLLLFAFLFFGLGAASVAPEHDLLVHVNEVTGAYQFDFIDWESQALVSELGRRLTGPRIPAEGSEQRRLVEEFLVLEQQVRDVEREIDLIYASRSGNGEGFTGARNLEQQLVQLR